MQLDELQASIEGRLNQSSQMRSVHLCYRINAPQLRNIKVGSQDPEIRNLARAFVENSWIDRFLAWHHQRLAERIPLRTSIVYDEIV